MWFQHFLHWLEQNWGTVLFGSVTLGTVISTIVLFIRQRIASTLAKKEFANLIKSFTKTSNEIIDAYNSEKDTNNNLTLKNYLLNQTQLVILDTLMKLALSSKLALEDKQNIVTNIERLKQHPPNETLENLGDDLNNVRENISNELDEKPEQTVYNIAQSAGTLLDKYNKDTKTH